MQDMDDTTNPAEIHPACLRSPRNRHPPIAQLRTANSLVPSGVMTLWWIFIGTMPVALVLWGGLRQFLRAHHEEPGFFLWNWTPLTDFVRAVRLAKVLGHWPWCVTGFAVVVFIQVGLLAVWGSVCLSD